MLSWKALMWIAKSFWMFFGYLFEVTLSCNQNQIKTATVQSVYSVLVMIISMLFFLPYKALVSDWILFSLNSMGPHAYTVICSCIICNYVCNRDGVFICIPCIPISVCTQFVCKDGKYVPILSAWFPES